MMFWSFCLFLSIFQMMVYGDFQAVATLPPSVIHARMPVQQYLKAYLSWTDSRPSQKQGENPGPVLLENPYLEVFSPSGVSLYQGTNDQENAGVIAALGQGAPEKLRPRTLSDHPSLAEDIDMVPELKGLKAALLDHTTYTVVAITNHDKEKCKYQDQAVAKLSPAPHVRLIEISLVF